MSEVANHKILICDPETDFLDWAKAHLEAPGVEVHTLNETSEQSIQKALSRKYSLIVTEVMMRPVNGVDFLKKARLEDPNALVILTTGFPTTNTVIESMRLGAYDFLRKESLAYELRSVVERALKASEDRKITLEGEAAPSFDLLQESIIGRSPAMQDVLKMIGRVSRSDAPVCITGESGCGKEVVAKAIHKFSTRSRNAFVAINCAAIPDNLLESELFGHEKGSFTGASTQRVGRFEQCDNGTLFLDEIGDMPLQVQSKILRVLQEGEFSRVGGNETLKTEVRILAATNKDLESAVSSGKFREDLFYRLNVVRIHLPPLRERKEDIALLANFFLQRFAAKKRTQRYRLVPESILALEKYSWPGNVRELENTLQRAVALATSDVLLPQDIPLGTQSWNALHTQTPDKVLDESLTAAASIIAKEPRVVPSADFDSESQSMDLSAAIHALLDHVEKSGFENFQNLFDQEIVSLALERAQGDLSKTAKVLGMTRAALKKKLEKTQG